MLLLALVFLPQIWSMNCTQNSTANNCASLLLVDDVLTPDCGSCDQTQCCVVDSEWAVGHYEEHSNSYFWNDGSSCMGNEAYAPFKSRDTLDFNPNSLMSFTSGQFWGYVVWQSFSGGSDPMQVNCSFPDFESQFGTPVGLAQNNFFRVPYVIKFIGQMECHIFVNGMEALPFKDSPVRLWAPSNTSWVDANSTAEIMEVGNELARVLCADGDNPWCNMTDRAAKSGSPFAVCQLNFVQCFSLGSSPFMMQDLAWLLDARLHRVSGNANVADMALGKLTHAALLLQPAPLSANMTNFSMFPPALAALAVQFAFEPIDLVVPTTLRAFVGTGGNVSIDASSGNLTDLVYFSGPFSINTTLVSMPAAVTVQLFPLNWKNIDDAWAPTITNHNSLCAYQAAWGASGPPLGTVSTTCTGPPVNQYCLQGLWPKLETLVISGIPLNLGDFFIATNLRKLVMDSSKASSFAFKVNPSEELQISNNPNLVGVTFTAGTPRATNVRVFGNPGLFAVNINAGVQTLDVSFSSAALVKSFDTMSFQNLTSFRCSMCRLTALPLAIENRMPRLKYLDLSVNNIQLQLDSFVTSPQWVKLRAALCRLKLDFNAIGGHFPENYTDLKVQGCGAGEEPQLNFSRNLIESFKSPGEYDGVSDRAAWASQFVVFPPEFENGICDSPSTVSTNTKLPWLDLRSNRLKGAIRCNSSLLIDTSYNNVHLPTDSNACILVSAWTSVFSDTSAKSMYMPFSVSWLESSTLTVDLQCTTPPNGFGLCLTGAQQGGGETPQTATNSFTIQFAGLNAGPSIDEGGMKLYDSSGNVFAQRQYGKLGNCYTYPPDSFSFLFEMWTVKTCSLGRGNQGGGGCELCPLNTWSEWCGNCLTPTMYLPDGYQHRSCSSCPQNMDGEGQNWMKTINTITRADTASNVNECVCPYGSYGFPAELKDGVAVSNCRDCREFAVCDQVNETRPDPRDGYYYNSSSNLFLGCDPSKACVGGTCILGYSPTPGGAPCSKCTEGYFRVNRECRQCFSAAPFLLVLLAVFLLFALFFLLKVSKTDATKLFAFSISLGYIQIISIFVAFPVTWPQTTQDMLNFLSFFNFNFDLASPECAVKTTFWNKWLMKLMLPLIAIALMWLWYLLIRVNHKLRERWVRFVTKKASLDRCLLRLMVGSKARKLVKQHQLMAMEAAPQDEREKTMEWERTHLQNRFVCSTVTLCTLGYTYVAKTSTQPFNCLQTVYETFPHLRADPSINCYDETWYNWLPLAIIFNLLYTVGIPLSFLVILVRAYKKRKLQDPEFLGNFGNLVLPFREQYWFWELIQLSRKLVTVMFIDFKADNSDTTTFGQINGVMLVLILFFVLQQFVRPYEFTWCNRLEFAWTGMTLLILMAALVFSFNILSAKQLNAYAVFLILSLCIALAITVYTLFLEKQRVLLRVGLGTIAFHKIEADHQLLDEVFGDDLGDSIYRQTRGMSPELREQFFARVSALTPMGLTPSGVELQSGSLTLKPKSDNNPAMYPSL